MNKLLSNLAFVAIIAAAMFGLGHLHGQGTKYRGLFRDGWRWGYYQRALFDQRMVAGQHPAEPEAPSVEAEDTDGPTQYAGPTQPSTSYLPAVH